MEPPEIVVLDCNDLGVNNASLQDLSLRETSPLHSQFHALKTIFPDIPQNVLWEKCVEFNGDTNMLQNFICDTFERKKTNVSSFSSESKEEDIHDLSIALDDFSQNVASSPDYKNNHGCNGDVENDVSDACHVNYSNVFETPEEKPSQNMELDKRNFTSKDSNECNASKSEIFFDSMPTSAESNVVNNTNAISDESVHVSQDSNEDMNVSLPSANSEHLQYFLCEITADTDGELNAVMKSDDEGDENDLESSAENFVDSDEDNITADIDEINITADTDRVNTTADTDEVDITANTDEINITADTDGVNTTADTDGVNTTADTDEVDITGLSEEVHDNLLLSGNFEESEVFEDTILELSFNIQEGEQHRSVLDENVLSDSIDFDEIDITSAEQSSPQGIPVVNLSSDSVEVIDEIECGGDDEEEDELFYEAPAEENLNDSLGEDLIDDGAIARAMAEEEAINFARNRASNPVEEAFELALNILPDADPEYLKFKCDESGGDLQKLETMIQEALEEDSYPTFDAYLEFKRAVAEEMDKINRISVTRFLEMFPNPIEHFHSVRQVSPQDVDEGISYLQRRFRMIRTADLHKVYSDHRYNLTRTCEYLCEWNGYCENNPRGDWDCIVPNGQSQDILYEIYFIEKEGLLREYLEAERNRKALIELREPKLECPICCDDGLEIEQMSACADAHIFCKNCIKRHVEVKIGEDATKFPCLDNTCSAEFPMRVIQQLLNPTLFLRTVQKIASNEIRAADIENLEMCPFCEYMAILPQGIVLFECQNPDCQKISCRFCKQLDHTPLRCEEVEKEEETKMRTDIEDRMTEALVRVCNSCKRKYVKLDGCNKMTCVCGAIMCYLCRKTVTDYTHFNGMGGDEYHKCPLFTNDALVHHEDVKVAAEKAKAEVVEQNPGLTLKNDPTLYLP